MAEAAGHKFGQIIGEEVLEPAIYPLLDDFAKGDKLYLDKEGDRPARNGRAVKWIDLYGNAHDLDFVLERDGSDYHIGTPVAFIETAWRRYTKHSKNKAQEIEGAIVPLVDTYSNAAPFIGAILAGDFTENAIKQLRSRGFKVLYFPYESVVKAFSKVGIDASFDEDTPDDELYLKIRAWKGLTEDQRGEVARTLIQLHQKDIQQFLDSLRQAARRRIELVRVLPLHGKFFDWSSLGEAISFIENYQSIDIGKTIRYEIEIRYNNGDRVQGQFSEKDQAIQFLRSYEPPRLQPA